jgi:F-type H+-transporting ATPase subunit b
VLRAVIHLQGSEVFLLPMEEEGAEEAVDEGPGPIVPEAKELYWGAGSFVVFAILMRLFLFPRVKKGMDARYHGIRAAHDAADTERASAKAEVADYDAQFAAVKAEASARVDTARHTLEAERQAALAEVNARIAEARSQAQARADEVRASVQDQIKSAVSDVAGRAGELATGRKPNADVLQRVVGEVMAQ